VASAPSARRRDSIRPRRFSTWVFQIAVTSAATASTAASGAVEPDDNLASTSDAPEARIDARRLLAALPEAQRTVLLLRYYHGLSEEKPPRCSVVTGHGEEPASRRPWSGSALRGVGMTGCEDALVAFLLDQVDGRRRSTTSARAHVAGPSSGGARARRAARCRPGPTPPRRWPARARRGGPAAARNAQGPPAGRLASRRRALAAALIPFGPPLSSTWRSCAPSTRYSALSCLTVSASISW